MQKCRWDIDEISILGRSGKGHCRRCEQAMLVEHEHHEQGRIGIRLLLVCMNDAVVFVRRFEEVCESVLRWLVSSWRAIMLIKIKLKLTRVKN